MRMNKAPLNNPRLNEPGTIWWTGYPILELGDIAGRPAPRRIAKLIKFDNNKYATVEIEGIVTDFKAGYLFETEEDCIAFETGAAS